MCRAIAHTHSVNVDPRWLTNDHCDDAVIKTSIAVHTQKIESIERQHKRAHNDEGRLIVLARVRRAPKRLGEQDPEYTHIDASTNWQIHQLHKCRLQSLPVTSHADRIISNTAPRLVPRSSSFYRRAHQIVKTRVGPFSFFSFDFARFRFFYYIRQKSHVCERIAIWGCITQTKESRAVDNDGNLFSQWVRTKMIKWRNTHMLANDEDDDEDDEYHMMIHARVHQREKEKKREDRDCLFAESSSLSMYAVAREREHRVCASVEWIDQHQQTIRRR